MLRFREFELDPELRELRRDGQRVAVQQKVLDLLLYLIRFRGRVVSRRELLASVWPDAVVTDHALDQALYQARKALGERGDARGILRTLRGRGVRFSADVTEVRDRSRAEAVPFVGRGELLGEFERALGSAFEGAGALILLGGEPGIGKTRVAEEMASLARQRGAVAHLARCCEVEDLAPLRPWAQLLRAHAADATPAPWSGPARFCLFERVARFWRRASQRQPIVLILDDLHRADPSSWSLLEWLAPELRSWRLLVVGTYRDAQLDRTRGARLGELARLPSARCHELEGFSLEEVARFAELAMAAPPGPGTAGFLHEHSNGNPFLLTRLIPVVEARRAAAAGRQIDGKGGLELPRSSREAVLRQLAGLSPTCRAVLTAAAVIGREFDLRVLELAAEQPREIVLDAVSAASEARVLRESRAPIGRFRFAHLLVRDALRGSLAPDDRVRLHRRVGEALESLCGPDSAEHLAVLAHHFAEAVPLGEEERAIAYCAAAGRAAAEQLAFEEAVRHYQRALEIAALAASADDGRLCDLLLALGRARLRAGARDEARQAFRRAGELARRLHDPERLARVALDAAPGHLAIEAGACDPLVVSLLRDALAALPPGDSALRARLLARLAMALYGSDSLTRRRRLIQAAARIAERLDDPGTAAFVALARIAALWSPDSFDDRRLQSAELIERAEEAGDRELSLVGRVLRIATLLEGADRESLDREVEIFSGLVRSPRHGGARWRAALFRAMRATLEGRFGDAERLARESLAEGRRLRDASAIRSFAALMAAVRWHQGRGQEVAGCLARFGESYPAVTAWRAAATLAQAGCGRVRQATLDFDRLARRGFSSVRRDANWLLCMALLAEVCGMLNDVGRAAALYRLARGYSDRWVVAGQGAVPWGPMARALGILAAVQSRWPEAEAHFRAAAEVAERIGAWPSLAWTLDSHARMLRARGRCQDRPRALELAQRAVQIGRRLGMDGLCRATRSLFALE